jgi:Fic family protein
MQWVYEHPQWPNWRWDSERVRELLVRAELLQARLAGRLEAYGDELVLEAKLNSRAEEVIRSFEIEGEALDNKALKSSIAKSLGVLNYPGEPNEQSVSLVALLNDINDNSARALTLDRLVSWHKLLMTGRQNFEPGLMRDDQRGPMQVISGPMGQEVVHFEAPSAQLLEPMLGQLFGWLESSRDHDFVKAALGQLWFVTIHPFADGNGRIARAISELFLARADGLGLRAYSVSREILGNRKAYYQLLEQTQRGDLDASAFVEWFLERVCDAIHTSFVELDMLSGRSRLMLSVGPELNERQLSTLRRLLDPHFEGKVTAQKIAKLGKCSVDTAQRDIAKYIQLGVLARDLAGGRSTKYLITV